MDTLERLTNQGKALGYEDEELKTFVKEQQAILREERQASREAERERREAERERREAEREAERERREAEQERERERQEAERERQETEAKLEREVRQREWEIRQREIELKEQELKAQMAERLRVYEAQEAERESVQKEAINFEELKAEEARKMRNADREAREQELKLEHEKFRMQVEFQNLQHAAEMERIEAQRMARPAPPPRDKPKPRQPKIPAFMEGKDEMDSYLLRFERYAEGQEWEKKYWATGLSALLQGKALDVYALMPKEDALDYDKLKRALLKRYELTEEGFRRKYKKCRPDPGETFQQFTSRMKGNFIRWVDMSGIEKSFEGLQDLILREQLTFMCNRELELFLREREPKSLEQASRLADQYKEARYVDIVNLTFKNNDRSRPRSRSRSPSLGTQQNARSGRFNPRVTCYSCGGPHFVKNCPNPKQGSMKAAGAQTGRGRSPTRKVTFTDQDSEDQNVKESDKETPTENQVCGVCCIHTNILTYSQASGEATVDSNKQNRVDDGIHVRSAASLLEMPTVQGMLGTKTVKVLRDTGCTGVIIRKALVPEQAYTGKTQSMVIVDSSSLVLPEARVCIDTPYYKGDVTALCFEKPLLDVIVGNIPGARESACPDKHWVPSLAVQTRDQAGEATQNSTLKTPDIIDSSITPEQITNAQIVDPTLRKIRELCETGEVRGKVSFIKKSGLLYRKFTSPKVKHGRVFVQLVVPQQFRKIVMELAHESIMSAHLAIKRTKQKVLADFSWPGISSDFKRFCQSCDICQRTLPKGRIIKAPLGKMPRINVPFQRVVMDIVGPLEPRTHNKNRYILTLTDYATRCPEAVPLQSIDTETVAEALVSIFRRVGVPSQKRMS